jgi:hypothetical protein
MYFLASKILGFFVVSSNCIPLSACGQKSDRRQAIARLTGRYRLHIPFSHACPELWILRRLDSQPAIATGGRDY